MAMEREKFAYASVQLLRCRKCGHEFKVMIYAIRPKCPKCKQPRPQTIK